MMIVMPSYALICVACLYSLAYRLHCIRPTFSTLSRLHCSTCDCEKKNTKRNGFRMFGTDNGPFKLPRYWKSKSIKTFESS